MSIALGKIFLIAVPALFIAASGPSKKKSAPVGGKGAPVSVSPNGYGLVGCDPIHTPSGKSNPPAVPGYATQADYQWCYRVKAGDTAGSITEMFWNEKDGWRYIELLTANPHKLTVGYVVTPDGNGEQLDFADLKEGETLYLPRTWNAYIDQTGVPRSQYNKAVV